MEDNKSNDTFSNYTRIEDFNTKYYYMYVHPIVTWTAALVNICCAIVFGQKDLQKSGVAFFQYSLLNSLGAAVGMILLSGYTISRCGDLCPQTYLLETQSYQFYAIFYMGNAFYFGGSLVQIAISIQIYSTIKKKYRIYNL